MARDNNKGTVNARVVSLPIRSEEGERKEQGYFHSERGENEIKFPLQRI